MILRKLSRKTTEYGEIASTNEELSRLLDEEELDEGCIIRADFQTSGKGHLGNVWQSDRGMNLLFSILLKPEFLPSKDVFYLSGITSLALTDVLVKQGIESVIKWPNDILADQKKIAGILIENSIIGDRILHSVIGIGLNINQTTFNSEIPYPTSMCLEKECQFDRDLLLEEFRNALEGWYQVLLSGHSDRIMEAYLDRLYRFDEPARFYDGIYEFTGRIKRVLPSGKLEIIAEGGKIRKFGFKEIEFLDRG